MRNDRNASKSIISRKSFLCTATLSALGLIAGIAEPPSAFANEGGIPQHANSAEFEIVPEEEINRLWESALEKARQNGDEIVLNKPLPESMKPVPYSTISATIQAGVMVGALPDVVYVLARYENKLNATRISKVYDVYAYGFQSTCEHGSYSHTIADGGRSLVVNATVTLRNTIGLAQSFRLFGEFGPTGGNFLKASYI